MTIAALKNATTQIAVCALKVTPGETMQRLIPAGQFDAPRGSMSGQGPWRLTEAGAQRVIALAAARSTEIPIDYEHQTLLADQNGKPAPAAGWVNPHKLEWREDGLYGPVKWTTAAAKAIAEDEYRYLSPVFPYDKGTGDVLDLLHLALTNNPAIDDAPALAALAAARMTVSHPSTQSEDSTVDKAQLIKLLGLAATATDQDIETALAALKSASTQLAALRADLGVDGEADAKTAVAALKSKAEGAKPDLAKYVPKAVYEEAQAQLAALKAGGDTKEIEQLIEQGLADGRIAGKATADWLREQGLAALKAHMEDSPAIAALKATQTNGKKPDGSEDEKDKDKLTAEELAVCKAMGLSPEDYKKANATS